MKSLNFYLKSRVRRHQLAVCTLAAFVIVSVVNLAYALDPNRALSQFPHELWGAASGFPGGTIYAIVQTSDGYLWLGTEKGLVRFDGLNFQLIQHSDIPELPEGPILGLIADSKGNLWIRLQNPSMVRYRNGKFEDVLTKLQRIEPQITAMTLSKDNEILLSTFENGILKFDGERFVALAAKTDIHQSIVISMAETSTGEIWMGTRDAGLLRLNGQQFSIITDGLPDQKINCLLPDENNRLLIGTDKGLVRWDGNRLTSDSMPPMLNKVQILSMLRDRDSNIWIGTDTLGLLRFNSGGITPVEKNESVTNSAVTALFEDREGNLWTGNDEGLERFRDSTFVTYSTAEGLPSEKNGPVWVDDGNRLWFAPLKGGLAWLKGNKIENVTADGLAQDIIYSITGGDKNDVWIGRQRGGLTNIRSDRSAKTYTQKDGLAQNSVYTVYQSRDGVVWAGTLSGGVSGFKDGKFSNYTTINGLASNTIMAIAEGVDGTMYFATPNGLSLFSNGKWQTLTGQNGLPSENIISLLADSSGVLWIGTAKGLAWLDSHGQIHLATEIPSTLQESIFGLAEDKNRFLWLASANHVLRVNRENLLSGIISADTVREYGLPDGLKSVEGVKRSQSVIGDKDGRIWFSLSRGISMVEANRLKSDSVPAIVQIQTISADGAPVESQENVQISSAKQRITLNFAGLSLSVPERVRFRYRLEGFDHDWSPPTNAREAVYTNLSPGLYSFHIIASNSEGIWNSSEAIFRFEITPMFWQTWWFWCLCFIAIALCLVGLYQLRLRRVTRRLNSRFEERLAERTLIAQELHDSLLQGFVSVSMQLNVAVDNVPANSKVKPQLNRILKLMEQVTDEGRNTLRGLRSNYGEKSDNLEQALAEIRQDLTISNQADFRVIVEGLPRQLSPIARDEAYHIGREALLNAYRHSGAEKIEAVVEYTTKHLKVLVRDDGCGIDEKILNVGRDGHWGLLGMRERAEKLGAHFKVWSRPDAGTEIELLVPGHIAFKNQSSSSLFKWLSKKFDRSSPNGENK